MTTLTKALITSAIVLAIGTGIQFHRLLNQQAQLDFLATKSAALKTQIEQSRLLRDQTLATLTVTQADSESVRHQTHPATGNTELDAWVGRVGRLKQWLRAAPEKGIPEMQYLTTNDWFSVIVDNPVDTDARIRDALSKLRATAKMKPQVGPNIMRALQAYRKANNGLPPSDSRQLSPYLNPPLSDEILRRYEAVAEVAGQNDVNGVVHEGSTVITRSPAILQEKASADEDYDMWLFFPESDGAVLMHASRFGNTVDRAMQAFSQTNNGKTAVTPEQLLPYFGAPVDQTKLKEYWAVRPNTY